LAINALLFDLGGTLLTRDIENRLVDEEALKSLAEYLASKGCTVSEEDLLWRYWTHYRMINDLRERFLIEIPMRVWLGSLISKLCNLHMIDEALNTVEATIVDARVESAILFPDTVNVLEVLRDSYRLGVVTNTSSEKVTKKILRRLDLNRYFECIVTSAELGVRKPYPGIFLYALREMRLRADETVFIGDSFKHDIIGSRQANMRNCLVCHEETEASDGLPAPDLAAKSLSELLRTLETTHHL